MTKPKDNITTPLKTPNLELSFINLNNLNDLFDLRSKLMLLNLLKKKQTKVKESPRNLFKIIEKGI